MSEIMRPMPFDQLMRWAVEEYRREGRIFGVQKEKFYRNTGGGQMEIFGERLSSAVGPAAGPNSQLAQNIIAAYLAGSRFVELKTVQKMDGEELRACVARPCINAEDEGYNVEWSTELTVPQAYEEYVKAWLAIHVLAKELDIASEKDFAFNMSVGYDLEGIQTEKIDSYIEGMKDATGRPVFEEGKTWLRENARLFRRVSTEDIDAISPKISGSVTLSTLHGCPPDEIERIANYLLTKKKVHTFVKCNPTLLGYELARGLLDGMGYGYIEFDDHHFKADLQFGDAVAMLRRLMEVAAAQSLWFGVKITNTFPVQIARGELPGEEMYMSGRALLPLSLNVANRLTEAFGGKLPISYSGGADAMNIEEIYRTGIRPITVATTILKPGGYERLKQLAEMLEPHLQPNWDGIDVAGLAKLVAELPQREFYRKDHRPAASRKTEVPLGPFDCFQAPCKTGGCPIEQQIPEYLSLVAQGRYDEAFRVIAIDNAAPGITGTLCNHNCQNLCTRVDYDESLQIRNAKRLAAEAAQADFVRAIRPAELRTGKRAAVVGAGPAGVAAALYLRRNGVAVTVLEKQDRPFGVVEYIIPRFRISADAIRRDFEMAKRAGVEFRFGVQVDDVETLRAEYDYVLLAVGAWKEGAQPMEHKNAKVRDALEFLAESKAKDCVVELGSTVAVIGGGDVAMDCARAAKRAPGVEAVTIVYRRTRDFMPAEKEEIRLALEDGVRLVELHAPLRYEGKSLRCEKMTLGDYDESGRRGIVGTGEEVTLEFDTVICAVGARVDDGLFRAAGLELNGRGRPVLSAANESSQPGVYVLGDCKAGPATVVAAMADAKKAAVHILGREGLPHDFVRVSAPLCTQELYSRKGLLKRACADNTDAARCLGCEQLCEICCDVCPNRANVRVRVPGFGNEAQILHIDGLCNECGNCGIFCPHSGNPYKDKVTLFWSEEDFTDSENRGFLPLGDGTYRMRLDDGSVVTAAPGDAGVPDSLARMIQYVVEHHTYYLA